MRVSSCNVLTLQGSPCPGTNVHIVRRFGCHSQQSALPVPSQLARKSVQAAKDYQNPTLTAVQMEVQPRLGPSRLPYISKYESLQA